MFYRHINKLLVISCAALAINATAVSQDLLDTILPVAAGQTLEATQPQLSEDERLMAFFQEQWNLDLSYNPEKKTQLGIKDQDYGSWTDRSQSHAIKMHMRQLASLAQLTSNYDYDKLSPARKLSYDFYKQFLDSSISDHTFRFHHYVIDQESGQIANLFSFLLNYHTVESLADAQAYLSRLEGLGAVIDQYRINSKASADKGIIVPAFAFDSIISGIDHLLDGTPLQDSGNENPLYQDFEQKIGKTGIHKDTQKQLLAQAESVLRGPVSGSITALVDELRRQQDLQKFSHGAWALPDGQAFYEHAIQLNTTLALDADDLHQTGLDEVARIHNEMQTIMQKVEFSGSLQDFFHFMKNNPDNYYPNTDVGRDAFLKDSKEQSTQVFAIAGDYFHRLPQAEFEVRRVEPWREQSSGIAFYNEPSIDGSRPGIYYANLKDMTKVQKYPFVSVGYHEGVPGHHFQIALAQEIKDVPNFQKFFGNTAYVEGWALYSEFLAKEMGFFKEPLEDFGRLQEELWRAIRLVVDTGMHSKKWSRERAIEYALTNSPYDEADVVQEIERFMVWPGQAVAYKVGMIKIQELRQMSANKLQDKYDIRDFHSAVLDNGALPLGLLEKQVDTYIEQKLAQ